MGGDLLSQHDEESAYAASVGNRVTLDEKAGAAIRAAYQEPPLRTRRIAIVGYAETCQPPADVWADPTIEKWTLNHGHNIDPRWDRLFEFHSRAVIDEESRLHFRGVDQWAVLRGETRRPIYMVDTHADVPCSVSFPLDAFERFFGARCVKLAKQAYVEMAAGFMLGYAVLLLSSGNPGTGAQFGDEIDLYGFELFEGSEYDQQRACFEFYAGWAMGAGITLHVPDTSAIFSSRGLYCYDTGEAQRLLNQADTYLKQRFDEVTAAFQAAKARNEQAVGEMQTIAGVMQEVEQQRKFVRHLLKGGNY